MTKKEAASLLCISFRSLITLRSEHKITYRLVGNSVRYTPGNQVEFEENCKKEGKFNNLLKI
ncbi:MAG: hypothetical protein Q8904_15840 [Bacteroidota bacterium]|nr:hypothetical protein [Bacteroidota bacterium]